MSLPSLPFDLEREALLALDAPPAERADKLAELVARHPAHASALRSLAAAAIAPASAPFLAGAPPVDPLLLAQVGPYRIERAIGQGGMGTVYLATQTAPVHRQVALKVVRAGSEHAAILARLQLEREALARMAHSCIAKVLDAGVLLDGRPFFVMEYVDGSPLTTFCDAQHLDVRARLLLFQDVCRGVQHAHNKGVMHRDLKPSNILVAREEGRAVPKIIDFGLARVLAGSGEQAFLTATGFAVGTPAYMSPEQAGRGESDVDARSDVFSLGVVLYEVLVGKLPFLDDRQITPGELERRIREDDPVRPSSRVLRLGAASAGVADRRGTTPARLRRALRGDLDWVTLRAMEKDRERRYQTPMELADDIGRHLASLPVRAGPPSVGYRARKFVRRNRALVAGSTLALAALLAGLGASVHFWLRAKDEAAGASQVNTFWSDLLTSADPDQLGKDVGLVAVMRVAQVRLDAGALGGKPLLEAQVRADIGKTYHALGESERARQQLVRATAILRAHGGDAAGVALILRERGRIADDLGEYEEAKSCYEEARAILDAHFGSRHEDTLAVVQDLALVQQHRGDLAGAEQGFRAALVAAEAALGAQHGITLTIRGNLAMVLLRLDQVGEARRMLDEVLAARRAGLGGARTEMLTALSNLGAVLFEQEEFAQAAQLLADAWHSRRQVLGPANVFTLNTGNSLAAALFKLGKRDEALQQQRDVDQDASAILPKDHNYMLNMRANLGFMLAQVGSDGEAETVLASALADAEPKAGVDREIVVALQHTLGELWTRQARLEAAEGALTRAHALGESAAPARLPKIRAALARLYEAWGKPGEAAKWR